MNRGRGIVGTHGDELIGTAVAHGVLDDFLANYGKDERITKLTDWSDTPACADSVTETSGSATDSAIGTAIGSATGGRARTTQTVQPPPRLRKQLAAIQTLVAVVPQPRPAPSATPRTLTLRKLAPPFARVIALPRCEVDRLDSLQVHPDAVRGQLRAGFTCDQNDDGASCDLWGQWGGHGERWSRSKSWCAIRPDGE